MLPYFLRSEDNVRGASEFHGAGGEMPIADQRSPRPLDRRLLEASAATGIPRIDDYNGPEQDGVSMFQVFQKDGRRWSAADAFLRPAMKRPNLELVTGATVLGLELDGRPRRRRPLPGQRGDRDDRPRRARGDPLRRARSARPRS